MQGRLTDSLNFVDRLYYVYFVGLGLLILIFRDGFPAWPAFVLLHVVCLGSITALAVGSSRSRVLRFLHDWYPLLAFIVCFEEVARLSFLIVDGWRDSYILGFEARLFVTPPTIWFRQFDSKLLTEAMEFGYFSYFLLLMVVGGVFYARKQERRFRQVMTANVLSYMVCYVFFLFFPTEGPAYTVAQPAGFGLAGGPFHWAVVYIQRYFGVHGNAFPSSHVAAGVSALVFALRYLPKLGAALTFVVLLLCAGAVYDGYHYFSDVVAGIGVGLFASVLVLGAEKQR